MYLLTYRHLRMKRLFHCGYNTPVNWFFMYGSEKNKLLFFFTQNCHQYLQCYITNFLLNEKIAKYYIYINNDFIIVINYSWSSIFQNLQTTEPCIVISKQIQTQILYETWSKFGIIYIVIWHTKLTWLRYHV